MPNLGKGKQRPPDSGLPRRQPGRVLGDETPITPHKHGHVEHRHRLGHIDHDHDDDGRPVFQADAKFEAARVTPPIQAEDKESRRETDAILSDPDAMGAIVEGLTEVLPATASHNSPGGQATADPTPPVVPDPRDGSESSLAAGSDDGGSGRPTEMSEALARVTPDAAEEVLKAAMGVINPAAEPGFAIRHAEESARVLIMGQHFANMLKAIAPPYVRLVEEADARGMWRLLRKIAATHGWDLDTDEEAGSWPS